MENAYAILARISPFRFLEISLREFSADRMHFMRYSAGESIFRSNDTDERFFILVDGSVEIYETRDGYETLITPVVPGRYFGEWGALFQAPRKYHARARSDCACYCLSGDDFRGLLHRSPAFSQSFGTSLRDNQGIFLAFERFRIALRQNANQGHINIDELLPLYSELNPALHGGANDPNRLDLGALQYAVRRLPDNVTRTFAFLLVDELPVAYAEPDRYFPVVRTAGRRRDIWEMMPGKNLVLLRSGDSDLIDLVSNLCVYAVEARKIRERLTRYLSISGAEGFTFPLSEPFSTREAEGLRTIWPDDTMSRLTDIARHREMFTIDVRRRQRNFYSRRSELWISQLAEAAEEILGIHPSDLDPTVGVHLVSSNTHSITNCLNPWFTENSEKIFAWGRENHPDIVAGPWKVEADLIYGLSRHYLVANPDEDVERQKRASSCGLTLLEHTASTGIQVQLIHLANHDWIGIDPVLLKSCRSVGNSDLIVNIDYAFGEQAEYIIRNLLLLFGKNVRSVNFLGKAGALQGNRGDILAPSAFVEQSSDLFQPLPRESLEQVSRLEELTDTVPVYKGPMLTVDGTLLQNRQMLNFYRHIWNVVGIEMEGIHYYRQILESRQLGVVSRDLDLRFFYYVSDIPLQALGRLSEPLQLFEGIPPLYAITRHILREILNSGREV